MTEPSGQRGPAPPRGRAVLTVAAALAAATVVLYQDLGAQRFYMDDFVVLRLARDHTVADILSAATNFDAATHWVYWRPGFHLLAKLAHALFGLGPAGYFACFVAAQLAAALAVALVAMRFTNSAAVGFGAGLLLLTSPTTQECVWWLSAALSVQPPTLLLFAAGLATLWGLQTGRWSAHGLSFAGFVASLTFREPGYHFPLFVFAAALLFRRQIRPRTLGRAAAIAAPYAAVVVFHFIALNRVEPESVGVVDLLVNASRQTSRQVAAMLALPAADGWVLAGAAGFVTAGLLRGTPASRAFVCWSCVALLPYALQTCAQRHAYLLHMVAAVVLPTILWQWSQRPRIVAAVATVAALLNATRLEAARRPHRDAGRFCADVLRLCERERLTEYEHLFPDFVPPALINGWGDMLALYLDADVQVLPVNTWPRPPFVILLNQTLAEGSGKTAYLRYEPDQPGHYRVVDREEQLAGRIPVPALAFAREIEVIDDPRAAEARAVSGDVDLARTAILTEPLPAGWEPTASDDHRVLGATITSGIRADVEASGRAVLLLHLPIDLAAPGVEVRVDGVPAVVRRANGPFHALLLEPGRHRITVDA